MFQLIAAPHTPLDAKGALAPGIVQQQVELLKSSNIAGAFICGTTGEGASLSTHERMTLLDRWIHEAGKSFPVIAHLGHTSLTEARVLAAHAEKAGASAAAAVGPFYFRPGRVGDLVDFCAAVAEACPALPFYYYDIPDITGVNLSMIDFLEAAAPRIPTLAGIKFTRNDPAQFLACHAFNGGRYEILWGLDETLLAGLALGAKGAVGSTYNYAAPVYRRLVDAFAGGDLETARREQLQSIALVRILVRFGVLRAGKAIMKLIGVDCGPTRSPVPPVEPEELRQLYRDIHKLDIFSRPLVAPGD